MKKKWNSKLIIIAALWLLACTPKTETANGDEYTCPMHPAVLTHAPGTCPVCAMDLVRKVSGGGTAVEITENLSGLTRSANERVVSSIQTVRGSYRPMPVSLQAKGTVAYDTRYAQSIASRVNGRLEKVYVTYYYQPVKKGQKLAEVYSPELVSAQREWLYLTTNDADNTGLLALAERKLLQLGLTTKQLQQIKARNDILYTIPLFSPADGYLVPADVKASATAATPQASGGAMDAMGAAPATAQTAPAPDPASTGTLLRVGNYVAAGETLFRMASASALRVELDLPAAQAAPVKVGTTVKLDFENGHTAQASVDLVQPFFSQGEAFVTMRIYTHNTGDLHIGHFVQATFTLEPHETLWLPQAAVIDLGLERVVFIKSNGAFVPRKVTTGMHTADAIEIREGIASADEVAANAQYMVDSESFIKPGN